MLIRWCFKYSTLGSFLDDCRLNVHQQHPLCARNDMRRDYNSSDYLSGKNTRVALLEIDTMDNRTRTTGETYMGTL